MFLVFAPELVSVSIAYTPEGLLDGNIVFLPNLTLSVMVILYWASESEYKEMKTVTVSPANGEFDLSEMKAEPLQVDQTYLLRIQATEGTRHVLFDKVFTRHGKLGFGMSALANAENPASRSPAPVRDIIPSVEALGILCVR